MSTDSRKAFESFVHTVPEICDRIVWRGRYIGLAEAAEITALRARCEAAEADARRYRWLRDQLLGQALTSIYALPVSWGVDYPGEAGKSMDAEIDAAIDASTKTA